MNFGKFFLFIALTIKASLAISQDKPNIVWITSEDNSIHYMDLYTKNGIATPNISELAEKGVVFKHAFSNGAVCSVARTTLFSGQYANKTGTQYHRAITKSSFPNQVNMFPWYLQRAGYHTSNNAKKDYNVNALEGWDVSSSKADWRDRKPNQPFFHVRNFHTTHEGKLHFTKEQQLSQKTQADLSKVSLFPMFPDTPTFRYTHAKYQDLHVKLDDQIGAFIDELKQESLMEDTIIFYFGDHGGVLPRSKGYVYQTGVHVPLVVYIPKKWQHIIDAKQGSRIDGFVSFVDFAPTLLHLAGADIPKHMDGQAFLGKGVSVKELNKRDQTYSYADRFDEKYDLVRSLRKGNFSYIRNYQSFNINGLFNEYRFRMLAYQEWNELYQQNKLTTQQKLFFEPKPPEALYDLKNDPFELNNLANNPHYAEKLKELRTNLDTKLRSLPDLSFIPESELFSNLSVSPTEYGKKHSKHILRLMDIASLSLKSYQSIKSELHDALTSKDALERYWALITCSNFGTIALENLSLIKEMSRLDSSNLVRLRAIEYLALFTDNYPRHLIQAIVNNAENEIELLLILNSLALIKQTQGKSIVIELNDIPEAWLNRKGPGIVERIEFLRE